MLQIRPAKKIEMEWINEKYDEVGFIHSVFEKEIIAIAEINDQKAGLGRLVTINKENLELGGIYVFDSFRRQGIARELVKFLLKFVDRRCAVYCIPFQHLVPFYEECGFSPCRDCAGVPEELMKKFLWCKGKYNNPTSLLLLNLSN